MNAEQAIQEVHEVVDKILPILDDRKADIQGGVLADLLARYLASGPPQIRDATLEALLSLMRAIVDENDPWRDGGRRLQ